MLRTIIVIFVIGYPLLWVGTNTHSPERFTQVMKAEGITQARNTGYAWFACSKDDWQQTGFTGIKNGQEVNGVICGGLLFKGDTVRYR